MKFHHVLTINLFIIACQGKISQKSNLFQKCFTQFSQIGLISDAATKEEDCENEEKEVEVCARDFLLYRNGSLPQNGPEMDKFCR